ncbi:PREDICTED: uncharacterized protein LOC106116895 [Papilio xuthus]|uniref:Uncharacterized protein LOC106116895 n=1 Tax=Papilio xuthus TaxID=66420 RepID=A0AAJ6Z6V5_PAPXU|nr:PREDICTED: uncharacterized protein LOC106116895 [Papilio xuthus]
MAINLLQANINHSARAQDLLFQSMAEWKIHVAVVAEPYRVPSGNEWVGDADGLVALTSRSVAGSPAFADVVRGRGYVAALVGDILVVGVYFSPNRSLADFERFLSEVLHDDPCSPGRRSVWDLASPGSIGFGAPTR